MLVNYVVYKTGTGDIVGRGSCNNERLPKKRGTRVLVVADNGGVHPRTHKVCLTTKRVLPKIE